jgi:hypothetical protein
MSGSDWTTISQSTHLLERHAVGKDSCPTGVHHTIVRKRSICSDQSDHMLLGAISHVIVLALWALTTPSSGIDSCDPASNPEFTVLPCLCSNLYDLACGFVTSGEGQRLTKGHARDGRIGMAEAGRLDFEE